MGYAQTSNQREEWIDTYDSMLSSDEDFPCNGLQEDVEWGAFFSVSMSSIQDLRRKAMQTDKILETVLQAISDSASQELADDRQAGENDYMEPPIAHPAGTDAGDQDTPGPSPDLDATRHGRAEPRDKSMNTPTREEFEARIAASEARSDARFIAFEKRVDESMHRIELELAPLKNIKISIWGAAATIIATFVAVFAIYVSAFDSGRETSKMAADAQAIAARAQQETVAALTQIRQIASDLKAVQPPAVDAPPSSPTRPQQ